MAERHMALREAFAHLSPSCQQLIILPTDNPSMYSAEVSEAGHPGPQHRADPPPLPGQAPPLPGHHSADQRQPPDHGVRCAASQLRLRG